MSLPTSSKVETAIAAARAAIVDLLNKRQELRPQFIRIAFYDAMSYDPIAKTGGPNGSIRLWEGSDSGMKTAIAALDNLKKGTSDEWKYVSYADLYQLAGIVAVEKDDGPHIEFQHGRMDSYIPADENKYQVFSQDSIPKLVDAFQRIGFTHKEIVALSLACYYWMNYSSTTQPVIHKDFYKAFYENLLKLEADDSKSKATSTTSIATSPSTTSPENQPSKSINTTSPLHYWRCLVSDASFCKYVELFDKEEPTLIKEYASAHKKLSELGFKQFPQCIPTKVEYQDIKHGIAFAVAMTIFFGFVGFFYEATRA